MSQYYNVGIACAEAREMAERWELLYDLWGGTKAMREAGKRWLPQNELESDQQYTARLNRSFLYNAYKQAIKRYIGTAFMKDIAIAGIPPDLAYLEHNADGTGRDITAIAAEMLEHLLITGKAHPLVDFPSKDGVVTLADINNGLRPYINPIDPRNLIGWRVTSASGFEVVDMIRFRDTIRNEVDVFMDTSENVLRVITPSEFSVYGTNEDGDYFPIIVEENTFGKVPIVQIYEQKVAPFVSEPPFEDLAWLNLRHWQSTSEQNNILHVARVPILFGKNLSLDSLSIGSNSAVLSEGVEDADLKYVEHTGSAIGAGRDDLKDIEERMGKSGAEILESRSVSRQTASARLIDSREGLSVGQVMLRNLERGIEQCFILAGEWIGVDASDVQVSIGDDLSTPLGSANGVSDLISLVEHKLITQEDVIQELKRRGEIGVHIDV